MSTPLRVLIIEDSEDDALLNLRALRRGGFDVTYERVETAEAMRAALLTPVPSPDERRQERGEGATGVRGEGWDIVLSDYHMPTFDGLSALKLLREMDADLPFILISGTVGEGTAVSAMKAGANDYLMKDNLTRLVPAVERELREAKIRREHRQAEEIIARQAREILEMSTPVLEVWEGVLVAPLVGTLGDQRAQQLVERLLKRIVETRASVALVDITGVPAIDTHTAQHLIKTAAAVRLLGAQMVLTGVRPPIAQTLVHLGIDLADVITYSSLVAGLRFALDHLKTARQDSTHAEKRK